MSFNMYTPLNKLNPSKLKWTIRVRAQAIWRGITRETKEFRGINILFIDDCNSRIHVFINAKFAALFEGDLEEGQIYKIENFLVHSYTGLESHRCVRTEQHIYFADYTKLEKTLNTIPSIPEYAFDFFDLLEVHKMEGNTRFLCDVIGILKDQEPKREYVNDNKEDKTQMKFSITDGRCTTKVTFFDEFAQSFEKALLKQSVKPIIIIIACAKIGTFQGELNLTNYPATRFYFNINHYSVKQLRSRALRPSFYENQLPGKLTPNYKVMSIMEIKQLDDQYLEDKVKCQVTMNRVDHGVQWYYYVCTNCPEELTMLDGRFKCGKCKRYIPYPQRRFRICTLCSDNSGVIAVVLEDPQVRRLTGTTVFALTLDEAEVSSEVTFPPILEALSGKVYTITLKLNKTKHGEDIEVYDACEIVEAVESISSKTSMQEVSGESEDSSHAIETPLTDSYPEKQTPNTEPSGNKVRKINITEGYIPDEHVPLSKIKNIKTKKV